MHSFATWWTVDLEIPDREEAELTLRTFASADEAVAFAKMLHEHELEVDIRLYCHVQDADYRMKSMLIRVWEVRKENR